MTSPPHGSWPTPFHPRDLTKERHFIDVGWRAGDVVWSEYGANQGQRVDILTVAADSAPIGLLPAAHSVRSRAVGWRGTSWTSSASGDVFYVNASDQQIWVTDGTRARRLTVPISGAPDSYSGLSWCAGSLVAVREVRGAELWYQLVVIHTSRSAKPRTLWQSHDYCASPRLSPDGSNLAWLTWGRRNMPWDGSVLLVAGCDITGLRDVRAYAGGPSESILQPEWSDDGQLYALSDRHGWWNLYRIDRPHKLDCVFAIDEDCAVPTWNTGARFFALLGGSMSGWAVVRHGNTSWTTTVVHLGSGERAALPHDFDGGPSAFSAAAISSNGSQVALIGADSQALPVVAVIDLESGSQRIVRRSPGQPIPTKWVPKPERLTVATDEGSVVHAIRYPATNPDIATRPEDRAPHLIWLHGGPTGQTGIGLNLRRLQYTSRGISVVEVNYRGSGGHGRRYRQCLLGHWGSFDVADTLAVASWVSDNLTRGAPILIGGESAGGYTALLALAARNMFALGVSYYGITDLVSLLSDASDDERPYLSALLGRRVDSAVSPVTVVERMRAPILLISADRDEIVPSSQADALIAKLRPRNMPYAHVSVEDDFHGLRHPNSQACAVEAELGFYASVLGVAMRGIPKIAMNTTTPVRAGLKN